MKVSNRVLCGVSGATRRIPSFRGLGRVYRLVNAWMLQAGADPVVCAYMKDGTHLRVDLRTNTELDAYYKGTYDSGLLIAVRELFDPHSIFLDIGGNIGFYTVAVGAFIQASQGRGAVVAFEPFPGNYDRLCGNVSLNGLDAICRVENVGLSDKAGEATLTLREDFLSGAGTGNASISTSPEMDRGFETTQIRLETLDEMVGTLKLDGRKIDMIKMDIEGHEDLCLSGGSEIIRSNRPTILMEVNKPYYVARGVDLDDVIFPSIPNRYIAFKQDGNAWVQIESLVACETIDNVFFVPEEKLGHGGYRMFL